MKEELQRIKEISVWIEEYADVLDKSLLKMKAVQLVANVNSLIDKDLG